jgi:TonB family protein
MLPPDPPEHRLSDPSDPLEPEADDPDAGLYLARLASTLAAHGGGDSSSDLALDLVLNEIVEQARLATTATGAAIALFRGEEMVCRATSGANAPDLGAPLNTRSGLSGACVHTRQVQRCDDTETDPRVDSAASRTLEVRSVLVLPVLDGELLLGVFEIFSPLVGAFSERDEQTLQALSRRIVHSVRRAAEPPVPPYPAAEPFSVVTHTDEGVAPHSLDEIRKVALSAQPRRRDHWTDLLNAIVIALALLLGWMVGRVGWEQAKSGSPSVNAPAPKLQTAQPAQPSSPAQNQVPPQPREKKPAPEAAVPAALKTQLKQSAGTEPPTDGLVVYEKGKVIFRMTPAPTATPAPALAAGHPEEGTDAVPISLPPEVASTYLVQRVEPVYPEAVRQQHLEGAVVLDAVVGPDGIVREVRAVSGDSELMAASVNAVRQWRFKPYMLNGAAVAFKTQITLNFTFP